MGDDAERHARDRALENFGDRVEDAADDVGEAFNALRGKRSRDEEVPPNEPDDDGSDVTININQ
jgi:hypothetical protein